MVLYQILVMEFSKLVNCYDNISSTRKRLEILGYLAELFEDLKNNPEEAKDLEKIVYLTQGTIYPTMSEQPKLGLAEKILLGIISRYYTTDIKKSQDILKKTGDLGSTAEILAKKRKGKKGQLMNFQGFGGAITSKDDTLAISDIYDKLAEISAISGNESQKSKEKKLRWLLSRCKPIMLKYLMRIITSTLRVGVSDPTIMDALAVAYLGDKAYRSEIERAYNVHPDLGFVARILYKEGLDGIKRIKIQVGMPIRMMLASRLEYKQILPKLGGKSFISEMKLDGERLQIHKNGKEVKIFSRKLTNISHQYPDVVKSVLNQVSAENVIMEGEAVAMDAFFEKMLPFQVLITRKRKYDIDEMVKKVPVCLYLFDILYLESDGKKEIVMDYPMLKRRKLLKSIIKQTQQIKNVEGKIINSTEELVEYFKYARSINCEGLMNKSLDSKNSIYKAGNRGFLWIKMKSMESGKMSDSIDVVPIGANWGKGRRANLYGVFLVAVYNKENEKFELLTRVATGFSDDDLNYFFNTLQEVQSDKKPNNVTCSEVPAVWFKPNMVLEIVGDELTISQKSDAGKLYKGKINNSGYSVRFPVFQRLRDEKTIWDATSVEEIVGMYKSQNEETN